VREELPLEPLLAALEDAAHLGYTVLSVSGGEPAAYPPLAQLLRSAKTLGLRTTVTSNGMLLDPSRLSAWAGSLDLLAISLDGKPDSHNRMRGSEKAFSLLQARLEDVRRSGIPFGFIFTLTLHNLDELEWVAQFAHDQGASLLQVHPLEKAGRARFELEGSEPDALEGACSFLELARLEQPYGGRLRFQTDLALRGVVANAPERVYANGLCESEANALFGELISPLVIEASGTAAPLEYGFARHFALGNIREERLATMAARWRGERYGAFRRLCQQVHGQILADPELTVVNWYEQVAQAASQIPAQASAG
jgi:MoaA/NifB/PqqE/SkfB family radical SAM enzyme